MKVALLFLCFACLGLSIGHMTMAQRLCKLEKFIDSLKNN